MMKRESSNNIKGIGFFNTLINSYSKFIIVFILILIITIIFLFPLKTLVARDFKTKEILNFWNIKDKDEITICYTHSVEKSNVAEKYKISQENLVLLETEFKSYGAGLPATTENKFELTEDGFRIYGIDKKYPSVIYRTGSEISDHKLIINGKKYRFLDFSKKRTGVEFKVEKTNIFRYILLKLF